MLKYLEKLTKILRIIEIMNKKYFSIFICVLFITASISLGTGSLWAQEDDDDTLIDEQPIEEVLEEGFDAEDEEEPEEDLAEDEEEPEEDEDEPDIDEQAADAPEIEGGEPGEGDNRRQIKIAGMIVMSYVFDNSSDSFTVRYRWELEGQANASISVIKGDANIEAEVDGFLAKWPSGECNLNVNVPKVPFELTFKTQGEEKGNIKLVFKKAITETWQSSCSFMDAPGATFETTGPPEKWFEKALSKARPPLRSIVVNIDEPETTTQMIINTQILGDPPVGSVEIEGNAIVTVTDL
ncbi:MAG: hypothetical protein HN337_03020 [Deltaproteobacteria bacterium]|jgi:hypothetical protein|nr:hypothetical protein [Deltaproteobacteria bacterium]